MTVAGARARLSAPLHRTLDLPPPDHRFLTTPLPDLAAWVRHFRDADIPILQASAEGLEALRTLEADDKADAHQIATLIEADPYFTVKVLAHVASRRRDRDSTETETVTTALLMMGVSPFFRAFGPQANVETLLADQARALAGVQRVLRRAQRSARFALAFGVHRMDQDVATIRLAAFVHDFAELLMWCHAPALVLEIVDKQRENPQLRSAALQRVVFNVEFQGLRQALMKLWGLPELLVRLSDERHADHPAVRSVVLAVRLARHTQDGWSNPALPDDFRDIARLLNASERAARGFVYKVDQVEEPSSP